MLGSFMRRLVPALANPKAVFNKETVRVTPLGAERDDPDVVALVHELEVELQRDLDGVTDPAELRARTEHLIDRHGMSRAGSEEFVIRMKMTSRRPSDPPDPAALAELESTLRDVTDPAEIQAAAERFAEEHGWTVEIDRSLGDSPDA